MITERPWRNPQSVARGRPFDRVAAALLGYRSTADSRRLNRVTLAGATSGSKWILSGAMVISAFAG